jgi:hypothetical protein
MAFMYVRVTIKLKYTYTKVSFKVLSVHKSKANIRRRRIDSRPLRYTVPDKGRVPRSTLLTFLKGHPLFSCFFYSVVTVVSYK